MQGECGLTGWREFVKRLCKDSNKMKVFKAAVDHEDLRVAKGMRVLYLQDVGLQEGKHCFLNYQVHFLLP